MSPNPFCASCTRDITGTIYVEPLGRNDALVKVCEDCATGEIRGGSYGFGELRSAAPGIGPGNRNRSAMGRRHG